jgi:hypothetical protein
LAAQPALSGHFIARNLARGSEAGGSESEPGAGRRCPEPALPMTWRSGGRRDPRPTEPGGARSGAGLPCRIDNDPAETGHSTSNRFPPEQPALCDEPIIPHDAPLTGRRSGGPERPPCPPGGRVRLAPGCAAGGVRVFRRRAPGRSRPSGAIGPPSQPERGLSFVPGGTRFGPCGGGKGNGVASK